MKRRLRSSDDDDFPEEEEMRRRRARPSLHRTSSSTSSSYYHHKSSANVGDDVSSWGGSSSRTQFRKSSDYNTFEHRRQQQQHGFGWHRSSSSSSFVGDKASHYRGDSMSYDVDHRIHRSESFSGSSRRDYFPKGPRSERDRSVRREEGSGMSSWRRRFGDIPDNEANGDGGGVRSGSDMDRASRERDDRVSSRKSPKGNSRDLNPMKSPTWSGSNQSKVRSPAAATGYSGRHGNIVKSSSSWSKEESASEPFSKVKSSSKGKTDDNKRKSSPTWSSKDSESEQSNARRSPPPKTREAKSPSSWSFKDSGSEQSKSVQDDKKPSLKVHVGGIVCSSDMEEGELKSEPDADAGDDGQNPSSTDELTEEVQSQSAVKQPDTSEFADEQQRDNNASIVKENCRAEMAKVTEESAEKPTLEKIHETESTSNRTSGNLDEILAASKVDNDSNHLTEEQHEPEEGNNENESSRDGCVAKPPSPLIDERNTGKGIDLELKAVEATDFKEMAKDSSVLHEALEVGMNLPMELAQNDEDTGQNIAVITTSGKADSVKADPATDIEARNFLSFGENNVEAPSSRGFELFSNSTSKRFEKISSFKLKEEKVALEALDLSLSLPNVLLPLGHHDAVAAPGSPSRATSVQSLTNTFCTDSEGFTASMSFTGSQSFMHNPSCSMTHTHNSIDYEQSVGSHPIFKGIDQASHESCPGQSNDEHKTKEIPIYQQILMNGGGTNQHFASTANGLNSQSSKKHHQWGFKGKPKATLGTDQQISQWQSPHEEIKTALQSSGCGKTTSEYSRENANIRGRTGGSLNMSSSFRERERLVIGASNWFETLTRLLSQPAEKMNRTFQELAELSIKMVKECVYELLLNVAYEGKLIGIQKMVQNRSDFTIEILLKFHRSLLEILVSLKTGMKEFLQPNTSYFASDLPEIFLNLRCKNPSCRSQLPVDECDCKICSQKNGFCSACMCLICSKFDMASNTCSWVGCDVCLHWCHTRCALGKSYIRNGLIIKGADRTPEMQFQCVACNHPSEMFGFVKEVFQNFAKDWSAETLSKELERVKQIFQASEDSRGRQIWDVASELLKRLENKANFSEVYNLLMRFLSGTELSDLGNSSNFVRKDTSNNHHHKGSNVIGPSQEPLWQTSVYPERALQVDRVTSVLPYFESNQKNRSILDLDPIRRSTKEPVFDELESIVKAKQAEAEMFQARSIDARREAECLKCIAVAKNEKTEQEYDSRLAKLRLFEAEELRKQKLEELQTLERAHREYFNMKIRMEADIKDLLLKMEATKRNLAK